MDPETNQHENLRNGDVPEWMREQARTTVLSRALDPSDAAELLAMLGIHPAHEEVTNERDS